MKQIIAYAFVIAASVLVADYAVAGTGNAGTYNSQGSSGAAVSVGTSATKVIPFVLGRTDTYIFNLGTVVEYCEAGPTGGGVPTPAPTSAGSNAFPIAAGGSIHLSVNGGYTPAGIGLIAQSEVDCVCSTGTCPTNTWELP